MVILEDFYNHFIMAFPKHKRTYGAKKGTKKMHCRAHKDKKK